MPSFSVLVSRFSGSQIAECCTVALPQEAGERMGFGSVEGDHCTAARACPTRQHSSARRLTNARISCDFALIWTESTIFVEHVFLPSDQSHSSRMKGERSCGYF